MKKQDLYTILLVIAIISLVSINELGYGIFALAGLPLAVWLFGKVFQTPA